MRVLAAALALLSLSAAPAHALVTNTVSLSPNAQKQFEKTYGTRESDELVLYIDKALNRSLQRQGVAATPLRIETTLISATPDHPTFKQLGDQVGLDWLRSVSLGGAELSAKLIDPGGKVVGEVRYDWRESDLRSAHSEGTWSGAYYAIGYFADRVAKLYAAKV